MRTGFDDLGGDLKVAGQHGVAHCLVDMALFKEPVPSQRMKLFLLFFGLTSEVFAQHFAQ
ncbi:hypothetical protein D3C76_1671950 [compost metagenome]